MRDEYFWAIFVLAWVFGWAMIWLQRKKAREAISSRRREMLHEERLAAIEKGLSFPELPQEDEEIPSWISDEVDRVRALWLLRISLILGLTSVLTGLGICLGFYFAPDRGFHGMWTIGLIPLMGGIGFLLYWRVASSWERSS